MVLYVVFFLFFAQQALRWLRGEKHDIEGEIKALEKSQKPPEEGPGDVNQKHSTLHELRRPSAFKPFMLLIGVFVIMQSTGTYAVIFYAVNVFQVLILTGPVPEWQN